MEIRIYRYKRKKPLIYQIKDFKNENTQGDIIKIITTNGKEKTIKNIERAWVWDNDKLVWCY